MAIFFYGWVYVFAFKFNHKSVCVGRCPDSDRCTIFYGQVIDAIKNKVVKCKD